jgi:flagellar hook protein FlgE
MFDLYVDNKNSLTSLEGALRIAISNANNFNTPGFKYSFTSFTTMYKEAISSGTETTNPLHTGSGMTIGSTSTAWEQGNLGLGTSLDAAIVGEGLFVLSNSATEFDSGSKKVYSRAGRFQADSTNTFLTDSFGRKVFGFKLDSQGNIASRDLVPIETGGSTDVGFTDSGILVDGFESNKSTGTATVPLYQLALTTFQNKNGLILTSGAAYESTVASGEQLLNGIAGEKIGGSDTNSYGNVLGSQLESSNVDIAKVALDMNLINRGFSAVQAVIDDVTKIIQNVMKIVGG